MKPASQHGSNSLYNTIDGAVLADVWKAFGWDVTEVDGHEKEIFNAYKKSLNNTKSPSVIVAKTIKGKGISFMEDNNDWHHNRITPKILEDCMTELNSGETNA